MILGLTGSIGSGKSTVAKMFQDLGGARVIDADAIAHQVQAPGEGAYEEIVSAFGQSIVRSDGFIDRGRLAAQVFNNPEKLELLNSIVHPKVRVEELRLIEEFRHEKLVLFMVPLLFENGLDEYCDRTVTVTVDQPVRERRLFERSGMTPFQVRARLANQMPQEEKARRSDYVIDNSGSLESTEQQVRQVLLSLEQGV